MKVRLLRIVICAYVGFFVAYLYFSPYYLNYLLIIKALMLLITIGYEKFNPSGMLCEAYLSSSQSFRN
jgi:hypothetical protein